MKRMNAFAVAAILAGAVVTARPCWAEDPPPATPPATQPTTRPIEPKALSANVNKGLKWLVDRQLPSGAWDQGEESAQMRGSNQAMEGSANVADTAVACLALLRSGSTPTAGPYATHLRKGVEYVCSSVEKSDNDSLFVTEVRNTRLQSKLGTYIDTFASALILAEMKDRMGDEAGNKRVLAALDKVMDKIEKNQKADGGFANAGWAPALTQGLASKAVNRAVVNGYDVSAQLKERTDSFANANFNVATGAVGAGGSAGVELYARASNMQSLKDADDANLKLEAELKQVVASPSTNPSEKVEQARVQLEKIQANREQLQAAQKAVVERLGDEQFVAGFGSNGGEEFLSYMNIGESLVAKGGEDWAKWDKKMTENLNHIQNDDGSWSGHHCITGKTFCTSSALLVLMVDRSPQTTTTAEQLKRR